MSKIKVLGILMLITSPVVIVIGHGATGVLLFMVGFAFFVAARIEQDMRR